MSLENQESLPQKTVELDSDPEFTDYDTESESENEFKARPCNFIKPAREYILFSYGKAILVPKAEFEEIRSKDLEFLRSKGICKNNQENGKHWEIKLKSERDKDFPNVQHYIDKELIELASVIDQYADDAPHMCGCWNKDHKWYTESVGNYALNRYGFSPKVISKNGRCLIVETFYFSDDYRWDGI